MEVMRRALVEEVLAARTTNQRSSTVFRDGRLMARQVCFAWTKHHCCADPCSSSRAHICKLYSGEHTGSEAERASRAGKANGARHEKVQ